MLFCHATPRNDTEIRTSLSPDERWREVLDGVEERVVVRQREDDDPIAVWGDGEPIGHLPIEITVIPNALPVAGARERRP